MFLESVFTSLYSPQAHLKSPEYKYFQLAEEIILLLSKVLSVVNERDLSLINSMLDTVTM